MLRVEDQLVDANAKISGSQSFAEVAGPSLGGVLVSAIGAAYTVGVDVLSFAVSTVLTARIRDPETARVATSAPVAVSPLRGQIREGLAFVFGHPILAKVVGCTATANFFASVAGALDVVFLVRVLGASSRVVGFVFALGALGGLAGAVMARQLANRIGTARIIWVSILAEAPFLFARAFAFPGVGVLLVSLTWAV